MSEVVIVSAARTPVGSFNGSFSNMSAADLGTIAIKEAINRAKIKTTDVSQVIMGQVLTASCGQNPARQASINAGIPNEVTALTINQVCGSGIRSIALGLESIMSNESEIVVAGGQENMTQAPHCFHLRQTGNMGDAEMIDSMIKDGYSALPQSLRDYVQFIEDEVNCKVSIISVGPERHQTIIR